VAARYWAWDADSNQFDWITGGYRDVPPGRKYVAGYWEQTSEGWRWVRGFWAPENQTEMPYVPQPPQPLQTEPSLPPPGDNYFFAPGTWTYGNDRFAWQPPYYAQYRSGMVWMPPHYVWTPAGYLFVSGYWDYPFDQCGLLFAPVAFRQPLWLDPGWGWRPQYALGFGSLLDCLFLDVGFGNYRFGDYYGGVYANRGIRPWHAHGRQRFDPYYDYYQWQNRGNPNWQAGLARRYDDRLAGRQPLPPRTLAQQTAFLQKGNNGAFRIAQPLTQFTDNNVRLTNVAGPVLTQQQQTTKAIRQATQARLNAETAFAKGPKGGKNGLPTLKLGDLPTGNKGPTANPMASKAVEPKLTLPAAKSASDVKSPPTPKLQQPLPDKKLTKDSNAGGPVKAAQGLPNIAGATQAKPPGPIANQQAPGKLPGGSQDVKPPPATKVLPPSTQNKNVQTLKSPPATAKQPAPPAKQLQLPTQQKKVDQNVKSPPPAAKQPQQQQKNFVQTVKPPPAAAKQSPSPPPQKLAVQSNKPPPASKSAPPVAKSAPKATLAAPKAAPQRSSSVGKSAPPPNRQVQARPNPPRQQAAGGGSNKGSKGGAKQGKKK
jgi:hypothetical protein